MIGQQLIGPAKGRDGLVQLFLLSQGDAEVIERLGETGLELDGLLVGGDRLGQLLLSIQGVAEIVVQIWDLPLSSEEITNDFLSFHRLVRADESPPEGNPKLWSRRPGSAVEPDGLLRPGRLLSLQQIPESDQQDNLLRMLGQGRSEHLFR